MASRLLTVSIRNYVNRQPRGKRRNRTVRYIREQIAHYTGMEVEQVKLDKKLNEKIVKFYSKSAVPVKMKLEIDKDKVIAAPFLAENTEIPKPKELTKDSKENNKDNKNLKETNKKVEEKKETEKDLKNDHSKE